MTVFCIPTKPEGPMRVWIRLKCQAEPGQNTPDCLTVRMRLPQGLRLQRDHVAQSWLPHPRWLLQEKEAMGLLVNLEDINYKVFVCVWKWFSFNFQEIPVLRFSLIPNVLKFTWIVPCGCNTFYSFLLPSANVSCIWGLFPSWLLSMLFCFSSLPLTWMRPVEFANKALHFARVTLYYS